MTRSTWVCWSITSETRIAYGSRILRHGRSRPNASNHAKSAASMDRGCLTLVLAFPVLDRRSGPREDDVFVLGVLCENLPGVEILDDLATDHRGEHQYANGRVRTV